MQSASKLQLLFIILILGLIAFIFIYGKNNPTSVIQNKPVDPEIETNLPENGERLNVSDNHAFNRYLEKNISNLDSTLQFKLNSLQQEENFQRLAEIWKDSLQNEGIAGYYLYLSAKEQETEEDYYEAADILTDVRKFEQDEDLIKFYATLSYDAYSRVLEINPENLNAKAEIGIIYVEVLREPMKGVGMLVENLEIDPEHEKSLFYLGYFSLQSGQHSRAVERLEKLVSIQEKKSQSAPFAHYYLGQAYLALKERDKAIAAFEQYGELVKDEGLKRNAQEIIRSIERN
jgi:tetratricopeptide (TPR) repeat protein